MSTAGFCTADDVEMATTLITSSSAERILCSCVVAVLMVLMVVTMVSSVPTTIGNDRSGSSADGGGETDIFSNVVCYCPNQKIRLVDV